MLGDSEEKNGPYYDNECLHAMESIMTVWETLLEMVVRGGP